MGHVVMTSELSGVPEHDVLCIEESTDPKRTAIFAFARKVSREPASVTREDVDALRPHLTDPQIVELVFSVCRYGTMNRLADAFGVPLEKENVFAPPAKGKRKRGETRKAPPAEPSAADVGPRTGRGLTRDGVPTGTVVAAGKLVILSVGSADGVRAGDTFSLSRGSAYVGRVLIAQVDRDRATGLFDTKHPGSGAPPQVGDRASLWGE